MENIDLSSAKDLAPNVDLKFISIKKILMSDSPDASILGILDIDGKLIMVPLKNLMKW